MAKAESSVGTAVKFPSCFKPWPGLCLSCEVLMAVVVLPPAGCEPAASLCGHHQCSQASSCIFCSELAAGCRLCSGGTFPSFFSAPSNTTQVDSAGVTADAVLSPHKVIFAACGLQAMVLSYLILNACFLLICYRHVPKGLSLQLLGCWFQGFLVGGKKSPSEFWGSLMVENCTFGWTAKCSEVVCSEVYIAARQKFTFRLGAAFGSILKVGTVWVRGVANHAGEHI